MSIPIPGFPRKGVCLHASFLHSVSFPLRQGSIPSGALCSIRFAAGAAALRLRHVLRASPRRHALAGARGQPVARAHAKSFSAPDPYVYASAHPVPHAHAFSFSFPYAHPRSSG